MGVVFLMKKVDLPEIIGDVLLIAFGVIMVYVFVTIEVMGRYGVEANAIMRRFEIGMGAFSFLFGIWHLRRDLK